MGFGRWGSTPGLPTSPVCSFRGPQLLPATVLYSVQHGRSSLSLHSMLFRYHVDETHRNLVLVYVNEPVVKAGSLDTVLLRVREPMMRLSEDSLYLMGYNRAKA